MMYKKEAVGSPLFQPVRVLEVELGRALPPVPAVDPGTGARYRQAISLVRLHARPLGLVALDVGGDGIDAAEHARRIWHRLAPEIGMHLREDGLPGVAGLDAAGLPGDGVPRCEQDRANLLSDAPFASIVVATRDRPTSLATCVRSLLSLDYPDYEVIIVDNAPTTRATLDLVEDVSRKSSRLQYVHEERPGLSWARNRGLEAARGAIIAFTDDDVVVDRRWLSDLATGFRRAEHVACVTGLVAPLELETPAQVWFEQRGGFSKGFARRVFDMAEHRPPDPLYPFAAGLFGSGNNMAFKTSILRDIGGFDPALGAGGPTLGGEDLAVYVQLITRGYTLVYEPAAIVHHAHRRDYAGLSKQLYAWGVGLTAYLTKCVADDPALLATFAVKAPRAVAYACSPRSPKSRPMPDDYPRRLFYAELRGMVHGPLAYVRGVRGARGRRGRRGRRGASAPPAPSVGKGQGRL